MNLSHEPSSMNSHMHDNRKLMFWLCIYLSKIYHIIYAGGAKFGNMVLFGFTHYYSLDVCIQSCILFAYVLQICFLDV